MKQKRFTFLLLFVANLFCASAQKWYTPEIDQKVEDLLKQMTVEEKLGYIGGVNWMYTKSIDRLGIHRMKMSDGPQGLGTNGKSTAYPSTVTLAATGMRISLTNTEKHWDAIAEPETLMSY
ncbi:hypothetical protein NXW58_06935 [Bacteroides faecis]|nr:hypothetical protein NXW58_06935 [Bacteroides faecis]